MTVPRLSPLLPTPTPACSIPTTSAANSASLRPCTPQNRNRSPTIHSKDPQTRSYIPRWAATIIHRSSRRHRESVLIRSSLDPRAHGHTNPDLHLAVQTNGTWVATGSPSSTRPPMEFLNGTRAAGCPAHSRPLMPLLHHPTVKRWANYPKFRRTDIPLPGDRPRVRFALIHPLFS